MIQTNIFCHFQFNLVKFYFIQVFVFRMCIPPEPFLLVVFSPLHSRPEFYECTTTDGRRSLSFDLSSCHDVIQLGKVSVGDQSFITFEFGYKKQILFNHDGSDPFVIILS